LKKKLRREREQKRSEPGRPRTSVESPEETCEGGKERK